MEPQTRDPPISPRLFYQKSDRTMTHSIFCLFRLRFKYASRIDAYNYQTASKHRKIAISTLVFSAFTCRSATTAEIVRAYSSQVPQAFTA